MGGEAHNIPHSEMKPRMEYFSQMEIPLRIQQKYRHFNPKSKEEEAMQTYIRETLKNPEEDWMKSISRSAILFSSDDCKKAILDSINLAWTTDKYRDVESKYGAR